MVTRAWLSLAAVACGGALALGACGGDDAGIGTSDAGADATTSPADDGGGPLADGGEDGGELITDGGSNIDLDAGDDDAGPDGGACHALVNDAPPVVSTCVSKLPPLTGGAIVPGKYFLTGVAALGSLTFCQNAFVPVGFKERMDVSAAGSGATFETVLSIGGLPDRRTTSTAVPGAGDTSPADVTNVCPNNNAGKVGYTSVVNANGKQILLLLLPYGKGLGVYRLEKQ